MFGPDVYYFGCANEAREKGDALLHCCNFARIQPSVPYKRHFQCYPQTKSVKFKFPSLAEYSTAESGSEATLRYLKHQPKGWGISTGRTDVVRGGRCFGQLPPSCGDSRSLRCGLLCADAHCTSGARTGDCLDLLHVMCMNIYA